MGRIFEEEICSDIKVIIFFGLLEGVWDAQAE